MASRKTAKLKRNISLLKALVAAPPKVRRQILAKCGDDAIGCLCDICYNLLKGNFGVGAQTKNKLKRIRKQIRFLAANNKSIKTKRKALVQKGGFLPSLLKPALLILATILGQAV